MFHPLELFVGLRYLGARQRNLYVSFISVISLLGIAVGVLTLIVVISVMNGFGNELRGRLLSLTAHVTVSGPGRGLAEPQRVVERVAAHPLVSDATAFVDGEALLVNGVNLNGVIIRGLDPAAGSQTLAGAVDAAVLDTLQPGSDRLIIGAELARTAGVIEGDEITVMIPRSSANGSIAPLLRRFRVAGVFEVGIAEHDSSSVLMHIEDAADLVGLPQGQVSGVRLTLSDIFRAGQVADELAASLNPELRVSDWTREQSSYFRAIRIEKAMMFVILLLIVAVAAFNIVATLVMVVGDKRTDIAILRTMGMRPGGIMRIFMVQGTLIGLIGTALGLVAGVSLALNVENLLPRMESWLGINLLPKDLYYITSVPSDLRWPEVGLIVLAALVLSVVATIYPARRAAKTHPAEALRYE
ncbi:MAG: lipoprotein-releasing ABC transporter permease subunit [Gammaproteobacteria bacterium]|nr:lipoprotein-releasing ABC transporter permease subunit [Gammaproteobacteria bacterium]NNM20973.1 lipoprotein-releasing ABC transporter permease subunit [Gammaproteobacteria bacterium]